MTDQQKATLKTRGWTQVVPGTWRSPLTGCDFTERQAEAMANLPSAKDRHRRLQGSALYRTRR